MTIFHLNWFQIQIPTHFFFKTKIKIKKTKIPITNFCFHYFLFFGFFVLEWRIFQNVKFHHLDFLIWIFFFFLLLFWIFFIFQTKLLTHEGTKKFHLIIHFCVFFFLCSCLFVCLLFVIVLIDWEWESVFLQLLYFNFLKKFFYVLEQLWRKRKRKTMKMTKRNRKKRKKDLNKKQKKKCWKKNWKREDLLEIEVWIEPKLWNERMRIVEKRGFFFFF